MKICLRFLYIFLPCFFSFSPLSLAQTDSLDVEDFFADEVLVSGDTLRLRYLDKKGRLKTEDTRIAGIEVYTRYYRYHKEFFGYYELAAQQSHSAHIPFRYYYPDSSLLSEGTFVRRKYDGSYKSYYKNGQAACICAYRNGKRNGLQQMFSEDGKRSFSGNYINGLREGIIEIFHSNGTIWTTRIYKDNRPWTVLSNFNSDGEIMEKGTLKDGEGTLYLYDENGKLEFIETYSKGKLKKTQRISVK